MSLVNQINTFNFKERINFIIIMKKYISSIKETNNCLRIYKIDKNTNKPIYKIGDKIILDKQIGLPSEYGIVYLSHFKLIKYAIKITNQTLQNKNEIIMLEKLTKFVIDFKCPHFPISYGYLKCNNSHLNDDYTMIKDKHNIKSYFPELINNNDNFYIQINELADGNLLNLILKGNIDLLNNITQILISIMFFHNYTKYYHMDTHVGNFLYHKIKPGGYFHYNIYGKDYYLKNIGYLWVIWDFGLIMSFKDGPYNKISINNDFYLLLKILYKFNNVENFSGFTLTENTICTSLFKNIIKKYNKTYDTKFLKTINKEILEFLLKNMSSFTTTKPSKIINKKPYIIR
jgi:hypothetical protein